MVIKILPNERGNPPGKLADAEIHFGPETPVLEGLKLIGFGIWERRNAPANRNVTMPARQYVVNAERRSFALLRPITDTTQQAKLRELILQAYAEWEEADPTAAAEQIATTHANAPEQAPTPDPIAPAHDPTRKPALQAFEF